MTPLRDTIDVSSVCHGKRPWEAHGQGNQFSNRTSFFVRSENNFAA